MVAPRRLRRVLSTPTPRTLHVTPDLSRTPEDDAATLRQVYDVIRQGLAARRREGEVRGATEAGKRAQAQRDAVRQQLQIVPLPDPSTPEPQPPDEGGTSDDR